MGKFRRVIGAYALASGAAVAPAAVAAELLRVWGAWPLLDTWQAVGAFWLLVVGSPTVAAGMANLFHEWGGKSPIVVQAASVRHIPVNNPLEWLRAWLSPAPAGTLADEAVGVWGMRPQGQAVGAALYVAEQITLKRDGIIVSEEALSRFLVGAYDRQKVGAHPFSRTYWVEKRPRRIEREDYELIMDTLKACGQISGRKGQGSTGRMAYTPGMTLRNLQHIYGSPPP